jgi:PiT family inorganic phosphate transporter
LDVSLLEIPMVLWLAGALAMYMAWAIGANDVANAMGTSVGSGAITIAQAVVIAGIFEFVGAYFVGGHVTDTVRKGILDVSLISDQELVCGMLSSLAAAATLLLIATSYGLPVSTTHAIVGAIIGFGAVAIDFDVVSWDKVMLIVASWVTSPLMGGVVAYLTFQYIRRSILDRSDPMAAAKRRAPIFFFAVTFVIGLVTLFKGLKNLHLDYDLPGAVIRAAGLGVIGAAAGWIFVNRVKRAADEDHSSRYHNVERVFGVLVVLTACAVAFAHGSNDVANAIGPLATVFQVVREGTAGAQAPVEPWMLVVGGVGIVAGLATMGYRVMDTVGRNITELTPSRGFAATFASAVTIVVASRAGIPVSTTHILVGSVLGVGMARGIAALDLRVVGRIFVSWIATLPVAAALSVFFYYSFKRLLA